MTGTNALCFQAHFGRLLPAAIVSLMALAPVVAQPADKQGEGAAQGSTPARWGRMPVVPGPAVTMRPFPPKAGRNRCIDMTTVAGAQMFGDRAIELSMKSGQRFRVFFARECPALSFYQGFYYRVSRAGQLCAGRDAIGARSGGECPIASIIPVRRFRH